MTDGQARPLRIVHVLRAPVGGLFRHVLDLSGAQIARGHEVGLIADSLTGGERGEALLRELAPKLELGLTRIPIHRLPHPTDIAALLETSRRLKELEPDVVHGHGSKGGVMARLAFPWRFGKGPIRAYTPHGGSLNYFPGTPSHRVFMGIESVLRWRTDLQLFESSYIAGRYESFVGRPKKLARVVRNGVGPREFEPVAAAPDATDLLYVGEFRLAKGLDTLLEALSLLKRDGRRLRLTLVGDGPERAMLHDLSEKLGVEDQLSVQAPMAVREAFTLGRIMVVPSRAESLPYIVLEAAGAHRPMVATNVGGMGEIFGPYGDRLIPCDDPPALARAIARRLDESAAESDDNVNDLSDYVSAHFSLAKMADGVLAAYREALARRGRA
jgi:glycosyltransferase involved in cell wall biosynthesis